MVLRDRTRLVVGSLGLGLVLWGLLLFGGQLYRAIETGRFENIPVRVIFEEPLIRRVLTPSAGGWFERFLVLTDLQTFVTWLLDEIPLCMLLLVVGSLVVWWTFVWEARESRAR